MGGMKNRRILILILLVAAAGRGWLLYSSAPAGRQTPDSAEYLQLAENLRDRGHFYRDGQPEIFRTPGYPLFLLACDPAGLAAKNDDAAAVRLEPYYALGWQVLLDVGLVCLTYWLGAILLDRRVGLLAAAFQAVTPVAIAASCRVLSDSLYAFLFTVSLLLLVAHLRSGRWWSLLASAAVLAAAVYVRPVGQVMIVIFALVLLTQPKRLRKVAAFLAVVAMLLSPWLIRSAIVADYYGLSSFAGDSLYKFSAPTVLAATEGRDVQKATEKLTKEEADYWSSPAKPSTAGRMARWRADRARRIILASPQAYAKIHMLGNLGFVLPGATDVLEVAGVTTGQRGTLGVLQREGLWAAVRHYFGGDMRAVWLAVPMVIIFVVKFFGVVVCAFRRLRLRMSAAEWLVLLVVIVSFLLGGLCSTPRFRVPIAPLLSLAAAVGLLGVIDAGRTFARRRVAARSNR
jgi:4-amino-4-deoxy-L-arabinose transferase-like glycosyltransferase